MSFLSVVQAIRVVGNLSLILSKKWCELCCFVDSATPGEFPGIPSLSKV